MNIMQPVTMMAAPESELKGVSGIGSNVGLSILKKSICELEVDDGEMLAIRRKLSAEKQALQGMLGELNAKCATRLPQKEYQKIQSQRGQIVKQLAEKENEIGELNAKRAELQTVLEVRKRQAGRFQPSDVKRLVEIRDRWHAFSMDKLNPRSARETAWKMSQELREFLKPYFDRTQVA